MYDLIIRAVLNTPWAILPEKLAAADRATASKTEATLDISERFEDALKRAYGDSEA